ncbi:MAG: hypothetical protein K2Y35_06545 [Burkholderiales bacterium]|nr:hypothetical protein [Burkholderiales bacterium]
MRAGSFARVLLLMGSVGATAHVCAHDLITAEAAERYIAQAQRNAATIRSREAAPKRAEAHLALARMQDEIRDLLNRDLAMHGRVQGLPSYLVVERFKAAGTPLPWSERLGRFGAPVEHYTAAYDLDPKGAGANDALYGVLYGRFYDSFRDDPLKSLDAEPGGSRILIDAGERFVRDFPRDGNVEEVRFIVAVAWVRVARAGGDSRPSAARARELLLRFQQDYPGSLRAAAVPVFMDALPPESR